MRTKATMSKRLETVTTITCMKTLPMLFNFIFKASGLLILCIGIWIRIRDCINMSVQSSGVCLLTVSCLGAVLMVVTILACWCTARDRMRLLYVYGSLFTVFAYLEFGISASVYRMNWDKEFDQKLNKTMAAYGQDRTMSNNIDFMQSTLHCCGNRGYTDWFNMYPPKNIPLSCCKVPKDKCETNDVEQIYTEGCYSLVLDYNYKNNFFASTVFVVAFFPLIVILPCCLARRHQQG